MPKKTYWVSVTLLIYWKNVATQKQEVCQYLQGVEESFLAYFAQILIKQEQPVN